MGVWLLGGGVCIVAEVCCDCAVGLWVCWEAKTGGGAEELEFESETEEELGTVGGCGWP